MADAPKALIATNVAWIHQALSLLARLDDKTFVSSPQGLAPHRVGSHLRHILEFYECFLQGVSAGRIDYDARKRDELVETSRYAAAGKACAILQKLEAIREVREDAPVRVRMEDAEEYLPSSISRELQALSSHTIHHFALIAVTLRLHGVAVDPEFGMSPATLRYKVMHALRTTSEAA